MALTSEGKKRTSQTLESLQHGVMTATLPFLVTPRAASSRFHAQTVPNLKEQNRKKAVAIGAWTNQFPLATLCRRKCGEEERRTERDWHAKTPQGRQRSHTWLRDGAARVSSDGWQVTVDRLADYWQWVVQLTWVGRLPEQSQVSLRSDFRWFGSDVCYWNENLYNSPQVNFPVLEGEDSVFFNFKVYQYWKEARRWFAQSVHWNKWNILFGPKQNRWNFISNRILIILQDVPSLGVELLRDVMDLQVIGPCCQLATG